MIEVNNINGSPEYKPNTKFGSIFTGDKFLFPESKEESDNYLNSLASIWDKEEYKKLITIEIDELILNTIKLYDYENLSEVVAEYYPNGLWEQEALNLLEWKTNLWILRDNYFETLTEETIINNFTETLPTFNG